MREAVPLLEAELAKNPAAVSYGGMPAPIVLGWAYRLLGDEALQLTARTPHILLYGAPDPHDRMFDSLVGAPEYEALLQRSRSKVDAERKRLGWGAL